MLFTTQAPQRTGIPPHAPNQTPSVLPAMPTISEVLQMFCTRADTVFKNSQSHRTALDQAISQSRMGSCFTVSLVTQYCHDSQKVNLRMNLFN